jgi:hypothetical protein
MQPTIGRTVHFKAPGTEGGEVYAAIITRVLSPTRVGLVTFGPRSVYFHDDVEQLVGDGDGDSDSSAGRGGWFWPPRV